MDNRIEIITKYSEGGWLITSSLTDTSHSEFPRDIYLWTLDRKGSLGEFRAIGNVDQVTRYPVYDSNRSNNFGIHLVRHDNSSQVTKSEEEAARCVIVLKEAFQTLLDGYEAEREPIIEYYPGAEE